MSDVFVSYSHEDRDNVLSVVTRLQHHGIDIWIDRYKIAGGSNFGQEIIEGIKACKTVLLMASDKALSSDAVLREVTFATEKSRRIIPLVIQSPLIETDRTGFWLAGLQRIDATGEFDQWSETLFRALRAANVTIQEGSDAANRPANDTSVITCLMADLADRAEQERQIFLGLERHLESRPSRPLVFVVHGRATQCIDEFIRRLFLHTLPDQFARLNLPNQLWCDLVPWPGQLAQERRDAAKERAKVYRFNLTQRLGLRPSETMVAVHAQLSRKRSPVALWSLIPSEHWQAEEPYLIDEVMRLWSELPDMSQPFVIPLVVAYREFGPLAAQPLASARSGPANSGNCCGAGDCGSP